MSYKSELQSNNTDLQSILDTLNALPDAGSGVEYEVITIPAGATSATYSLSRVTAAYGAVDQYIEEEFDAHTIMSICDNVYRYMLNGGSFGFATESEVVRYKNGSITWGSGGSVNYPIKLLLINDPNAPAIST